MAMALLAPLALPLVGQALGGVLGGGQPAGGAGDPISNLLKMVTGGLSNPLKGILGVLGVK